MGVDCQGYAGTLHGGLFAVIMDEVMGTAANFQSGKPTVPPTRPLPFPSASLGDAPPFLTRAKQLHSQRRVHGALHDQLQAADQDAPGAAVTGPRYQEGGAEAARSRVDRGQGRYVCPPSISHASPPLSVPWLPNTYLPSLLCPAVPTPLQSPPSCLRR